MTDERYGDYCLICDDLLADHCPICDGCLVPSSMQCTCDGDDEYWEVES